MFIMREGKQLRYMQLHLFHGAESIGSASEASGAAEHHDEAGPGSECATLHTTESSALSLSTETTAGAGSDLGYDTDTCPSSYVSSRESTRSATPDPAVADTIRSDSGVGAHPITLREDIGEKGACGTVEALSEKPQLRAVDSLEFDVAGLDPTAKGPSEDLDAPDLDRRRLGVGAKLGAKIRRMQSRLANYVG
jgi:hypothetical protein